MVKTCLSPKRVPNDRNLPLCSPLTPLGAPALVDMVLHTVMSMRLLKILLLPPALLQTHVRGYAGLTSQLWRQSLRVWKTRLAIYAIAAVCLLLGLLLAGVSLLLWSALPVLAQNSAWVLLALPCALLALAVVCQAWANRLRMPAAFDTLKAQLELDIAALRQSQKP